MTDCMHEWEHYGYAWAICKTCGAKWSWETLYRNAVEQGRGVLAQVRRETDAEIRELRAKCARFGKALRWYSDPDVWRVPMREEMANADDEPLSDAQVDGGARARAAIEALTVAHTGGAKT